jgi:hypothetical protein
MPRVLAAIPGAYGMWGGITEEERHKIFAHTIARERRSGLSTDEEDFDD